MLRNILRLCRPESASKDGTYYPQIIIIMGSNYSNSEDAVPGPGQGSEVEHWFSMCESLCSVPSNIHRRLRCDTDIPST